MTIDTRDGVDIGIKEYFEEYYTLQQLGKILKMDPQTVVRLFRGQPGVIEYGSDERLHKRKRKFLRISKSALKRFLEKQGTSK